MDRTAIEAIRENPAFNIDDIKETDAPAVVMPANAQLASLEHLMCQPVRFKARFDTHIVDEFNVYCAENKNNDSAIYINTDDMVALAIFDHGKPRQPEWADHRARVTLRKKPAFAELLEKNNRLHDQQALIDFLTDWQPLITLFDGDNKALNFQVAINRIRKLTLNKNSSAEFEQSDFNHTASAMESVEIKSGDNEIPAYFEMKLVPYHGFSIQKISCNLRAKTNENTVAVKYRIDGLQAIEEKIANEFRTMISDVLTGETTIYIGTMGIR